MVRGSWLATREVASSTLGHFTVTLGKLFRHICLCHQAVLFGTIRGAVMSYDWEGNRRSGVALAMHHRLQWFMHVRAQGLSKGDEHPTNTSWGMVLITFLFVLSLWIFSRQMSVATTFHFYYY